MNNKDRSRHEQAFFCRKPALLYNPFSFVYNVWYQFSQTEFVWQVMLAWI